MIAGRFSQGLLPAMGALALLAACASEAPAPPEPTVGEIESAMDESVAGWNAGDLDRFMAVYSPSPEMTFAGGNRLIRGKSDLAQRYRDSYPFDSLETRGMLSLETLDFRVLDPNHVLYIARYTVAYPERENAVGLTSLVFAREDGEWRIVADHSG